ncbi:malonyl-ACP O-methyltransferase BioC [uncultured Acetobacteroides sp.]|uniref:malonyl-ACP O-methyltransferase BioC n=1 Tax=uncultured Acetobacteroides sp. TaxID=1760811 RepID=UPI0029F5C084|nr:malonyl-ACP O-methyltransferase BioC [uncultured Acetobacteroides sp.]
MNKKAVRDGFTGCYGTYATEAVVQQAIAQRLAALLDKHVGGVINRAVEVGCGSGFLTQMVLERFPKAAWLLNDIAPSSKGYVDEAAQRCNAVDATFELGDAEAMELPSGIDLFVSSSAVQWFSDLEGFLKRLSEAMSEGGTVAISTFGPQNLREVRELTGSGLSYLSHDAFRAAVSRYFDVEECLEDRTSIYFDEPVEVLRHIKQTGVNGAFRQCWTKGKLARFTEGYEEFRSANGYPLTYHPMYVVARKGGGSSE